jgi:acyl carrier protein
LCISSIFIKIGKLLAASPEMWPGFSGGRDWRQTLLMTIHFFVDKENIMSDITSRVINVVADQLSVDAGEIRPESSFQDDLGADSLDLVELIMAMEEEFDVKIDDDAAQKIKTVQNAVDFIESISK